MKSLAKRERISDRLGHYTVKEQPPTSHSSHGVFQGGDRGEDKRKAVDV